MAKFMLAHLQEGSLGDARILRPETVRLMHSRLFALDPAALGMAHGFYEETRNGHRIVGHGGDTLAFHSDLHLIEDAGVGFFVSYNSGGKGEVSPRTSSGKLFSIVTFRSIRLLSRHWKAKDDARGQRHVRGGRRETSFLKVASVLGEMEVSAR
jgi:hypothetical protein